jgi:hypothetical protein
MTEQNDPKLAIRGYWKDKQRIHREKIKKIKEKKVGVN